MKRALADILFFLAATAVVLFALSLFIIVFQVQNTVGLDRAYLSRAWSFVVEFVKRDKQALGWFGLFAGLVVIVMARLICHLPRLQWELDAVARRVRRPRRPHPPDLI